MTFIVTPKKLMFTHDDELEMLEKLSFTDPCERAILQFNANGSRRRMNLSELEAPKGHCVWCDGKLTGRQQRWCSSSCVHAAMFRADPQGPDAKVYRLIHDQNWACKMCGLSFEDELRKKIRRKHEAENRIGAQIYAPTWKYRTEDDPESKISYNLIGQNTGHLFQTDHIIPIHKGGAGIEPCNLQTICVECHKEKTKEDLKVIKQEKQMEFGAC